MEGLDRSTRAAEFKGQCEEGGKEDDGEDGGDEEVGGYFNKLGEDGNDDDAGLRGGDAERDADRPEVEFAHVVDGEDVPDARAEEHDAAGKGEEFGEQAATGGEEHGDGEDQADEEEGSA